MRMRKGMRFRKRLSAAILAAVMMLSSIQIPSGTSYAAEIAGSGITSGQTASVLTVEETEGAETVGETQPDEGMVTDGGSQTGDDNLAGDDNPAGDDSQTGDDNPAGDDSQTGDDNPAGDDSQTGDDNPAGDDSQTGDENDSEEETEDAQVSGNDLVEPALFAVSEKAITEDIRIVEAEIEGAYQFGDAPSGSGNIADISAPTYDDSVIDYVYRQMLKRKDIIDISIYDVTEETVGNLVSGVLNEHPDLYFVNKSYNYGLLADEVTVASLMMTYSTEYNDAAFEEKANAALTCVTDGMSDYEKAAALHDWLAVNVEYDYDNFMWMKVPAVSYSAYGALVNGVSVCQGYALAYKYLLGKLGIECYMVSSEKMEHAWNMVKLGGEYYHVDVTWDDPYRDIVGRASHTNMLCSDEIFKKLNHYDWKVTSGSDEVDYKATDVAYDYAFWRRSDAPLVFKGDSCYYVSAEGSLRKAKFTDITGTGTQLVNIGKWYTNRGESVTGACSGLYMINDRLFYNDAASIYSIKGDGTDKRTEFTPDKAEGYSIFGSGYRQGKVCYALHTDPFLTEKENVLIAEITGAGGEEEETKEAYNIDPASLPNNYMLPDTRTKVSAMPDSGMGIVMFYKESDSGMLFDYIQDFKECFEGTGLEFICIEVSNGWDMWNGSYPLVNFNNAKFAVKMGADADGNIIGLDATDDAREYCQAVQEKNPSMAAADKPYPSLFYIGDGKIQYAEMNPDSAYSILCHLQEYCGYTRYAITYHVNSGGTNDIITKTYDASDEDQDIIQVTPPYRDGYCFDGWYSDETYTEMVTKIPAGTKGNIELYAKWKKKGSNLDNPEYNFETVDGSGSGSSQAADGKPKLLVFANENCGFSRDLAEDITANIDWFGGVDVVFAVVTKTNITSANQYMLNIKNNYGCDEIIFCADGGENTSVLNDYVKRGNYQTVNGTVSSPVVVYIDGDNKLQYVETQYNAEGAFNNLREYCNYDVYRINYELGGGTNNSGNPKIYFGGSQTITLLSPYRQDYQFDGWYKDAEFEEKVTEIPEGSMDDITLYAKWVRASGKEGLNAENPDYTFTTLDGETVSSKADGKPKVLFFFSTTCGRCIRANSDLSKNIKSFDGVDIYAIESFKMTKEEVEQFKNDYGCDEITYCYDTNGRYNRYYWAYADIVHAGNTTPLIVYIDSENHVQYGTAGEKNCTEILTALWEYCGYSNGNTEGIYKITYKLNGGKNSGNNPSIYTAGTQTIVLEDAVKEGYVFGGWYTDAEFKEQVTQITKGSTGDITLYAKWENSTENPDYTFTTLDDETVSSKADGKPKVLFFFKTTCGFCQSTNQSLSKYINIFSGADIYAIEIEGKTKEEVANFKDTYGCDEITYCYDKDGTYDRCFWDYVKDVTHVSTGGSVTTPVIVFIDSENRVQHATTGGRSADEILTDLQQYCDYDYYRISYELGYGENNSENPEFYRSNGDTITLKDPVREGYLFDGWYKDVEFKEKVTEIVKGTTGNVTLYAKWKIGAENPDYTFTTLDEETVSSRADGKPKVLFFFRQSSAMCQKMIQELSQHIENFNGVDIYAIEAAQAAKTAVANFKNDYGCDEITFCYDTGESNMQCIYDYVDIAQVNNVGVPFTVYIDSQNRVQHAELGQRSYIEILTNLRNYCDYRYEVPEGTYKITYELNGGTNSSENPATYTAETENITLADAVREGYTFEGWYKDAEFNEQVTQIAKGSTGNITLYAKWKADGVNGLDLPNFDQTYSGIDGKKLSSKADGKPKLLVFFMWDQDAGKETMQNITGVIDSLSGVDVYAIDMTQSGSLDLAGKTKEYKEAYGCDEIKFAYADWNSPANYDKGDAYQQAAGLSGMYLPLMCYIDKDNRLQWVSDHEQTSGQILANLEKYCGYITENPPEGQGTYKIIYVLDGGTNDEDNPGTYTAETETIVLKDASKTGCIFEGWYADARFNEKVTEIARGSEGNITLYAKWSMSGLDAANPDYTFTTLDDETVSSQANGKPKVLFFFKTDCLNCRQTNEGISKNIKSFGGADIYAIEINEKTKEEVANFKDTYGCDEITYCYDKDRTYNTCFWDYVRNIIHVDNEGFVSTPVIVYIDSENRVQYGAAGLRSWTDILTDLQEYCGYNYEDMEEIYKISYALDGGTNHSTNPGTYTATQTIFLRDPTKEGYIFDGWYKDAEFKKKVTQIVRGSTGDITLYAKWKKGAENPDYTFTTLDDETVSSKADGKPKVLFFFKTGCQYCRNTSWLLSRNIEIFCGADIYAVEISERTKEQVAEFKEDVGCDEITYCYDKDGTYNACFWDYVRDVTHIASGAVETPVLVYIDSENRVQYATSGERSHVDILTDLQKHCGYDYYWINYYLGNGENNSENPEFYKSDGDTIILKDPVREGYKFRGWYKDLEYTQKVTQIPTGSTGDITFYAKWIEARRGLGVANLDRTFTALDDTIISSKADGKPKLLIFLSVSQDDEYDTAASDAVKDISQSISKFAGVDVYVIDFELNPKADVSWYKELYGCDEMTFAYDTTNGTKSIVREYLRAAGQPDFFYSAPVICYIDEYDMLQWMTQGKISAQTVLDNLDMYCDYMPEEYVPIPAGTYKITYELNGGTNSSENPATYTADTETITLVDAVREGYIFVGWYKDADFKEQVTQIVKGSAGNITLYARWRAEDDPDNQDDTGTYQVVFDVQGHGTAPQTLADIKAGSTIDSPEEPVAEGYRFDGWYKDSACTKPWDFGTDTVQSDLTLYAKWLCVSSDGEFAVQEIADLYYNGKVQKPAVSVYDENTLLKAGRDYTVKYYNNINANKNGVLKGEEFNQALPYVEITGKGNYKETVRINFNILRSSIGYDSKPASGVTLKVNDQLVKTNKDQKPFGSIKYGRNMKEGTDYKLELSIVSAKDGYGINAMGTCTGAKVPANYTGQFMLTVTGTGNYTGSISRMVYVADKAHLMKNVKITLGKDLKNIPFTGSGIELKAAEKPKPADDEFVVTYGSTVLKPYVDYSVYYDSKAGVGKAELVVTGKNGYVGSKTATFNIKGKAFTNGTVEVTGLVDQAYTGRAIVQNAGLIWKADGTKLVYGVDYTVSYSKNINKGTATVTFTGKAKAGYSGKISKKFKITAADISKVTRAQSMNAITLPYTKAGVKPVDEIILTNERGIRLSNGKDYTLSYKNNKAVADASAEKAPTVTVKGKGNYSGSFEVKFTIEQADLRGENITIECAQVMYDVKKAADYEYKPTVTIKDGKTKLKAGTDYEISYVRNTQKDFGYYMMSSTAMKEKLKPVAVISAKEGSAYTMQESFEVTLQIFYMDKLTKNNLEVEIGEAVYTGGQVRPEVTVKYMGGAFTEGRDYTLIYGANTAAGKNKGSVTIKGLAPEYGGSVTYKFDITRKDLKYGFLPVINEK